MREWNIAFELYVIAPWGRCTSIADVHGHSQGIKMAALFAAGLMPWPKHFFPKTSGRLSQLISRATVDRQKAVGHV